MVTSRLWVLGASDPEMAAIENLLKQMGEGVVYATCGGVRVHPGNAYKAEKVEGIRPRCPSCGWEEMTPGECPKCPGYMITYPEIIHVECSTGSQGLSVDHHRPGDPGYGKPPEEYMEASSLGQVAKLCGCQPADTDRKLIAAADHCLEAAYRGKCPGVKPDELMQWRAESRAAFQKRPVAEVLRDVRAAMVALREAPLIDGGQDSSVQLYDRENDPEGQWPQGAFHGQFVVRDLRGKQVAELPEAAARLGWAFISTVKEKDGREKVVLQAAPNEVVSRFMRGKVVPDLTDYYGDPARGFAGGYIKPKQG